VSDPQRPTRPPAPGATAAGRARPADRPDLRLLPVVVGMWIAQGAVLLLGPRAAHPALAVGVGLLVLGLAAIVWWGGRWWPFPAAAPGASRRAGQPPSHVLPVLLGVVGLALGSMVAGLHLVRLHPPVLAAAAEQRMVVHAEARITGDPVAHVPAHDGGRTPEPSWSVAARLEHVVVRGQPLSVGAPVLLRGDAVHALRYGSAVSLAARAATAWDPGTRTMALQVLGTVHERAPPGPVASATNRVREAFRAACEGLPPDAGALLLGLAVGDESTLSGVLDAAMVRAGLAHLTAVSGSNTALVMGLALAGAAALGMGWRARIIVSLAVLGAYVALVRPQPSVLRAAGMGVVAMVAVGVGGRRRGSSALFAAALVLLALVPSYALSLGFALSVAATAGLLLVGPGVAERLARWPGSRHLPEPIRAALAVAIAAHLATLPLAILMGNGASLVALPANVLVTPLVPVATVLGLAAALLAPAWLPGASLLAQLAAPATATIAWVAHTGSGLPFGVVAVPAGPGTALLAAGVLGVGLLLATGGPQRARPGLAVLAAMLAIALALGGRTLDPTGWPPPDWVVLACDVGQGDGVLVRAPGSPDAVLVDVGPEDAGVGRCAARAGVRRVVVVLTHFHADHVDGLDEVLAELEVVAILASPVLEPQDGARVALGEAAAAGVPVDWLRAGSRSLVMGLPLDVRWPARPMAQSPANNASVVAVAAIPTPNGPIRVLLTGDLEPEAQQVVMAGPPPGAHVVKVPHHGSVHQAHGFARWSGARIALVSVGRGNDYGHPSAATLDSYQRLGALVGRTDEQGALAVVLRSGGPALVVQR
jgi:competence protein ComEC